MSAFRFGLTIPQWEKEKWKPDFVIHHCFKRRIKEALAKKLVPGNLL